VLASLTTVMGGVLAYFSLGRRAGVLPYVLAWAGFQLHLYCRR